MNCQSFFKMINSRNLTSPIRRRIFSTVLPVFFAGLPILVAPCHAQQKKLVINTTAIDSNKLPFPGQTITLEAEVSNTRDFRLPVRLLAVRDGKFYEIAAPSGLLAASDHPQYKVEIPAPVAELVYQFVLMSPDGSVASSQRVSLRRKCIPNILPAFGELPDDVDGSERFNLLLTDNKRMELEIDNLERAAKLVDVISDLVAQ